MLYQSGEDYLETILLLQQEKGFVRSIDIAEKLGYSKPSVSRAMSNLKKEEYIIMDTKGLISFTTKGFETATKIYKRHKSITQFLIKSLGIDEITAEEDACKIEHIISDITLEKIEEYIAK